MRTVWIGLLALTVALPGWAGARKPKKPNPTWSDPAKAAKEDPDFLVQGEYGVDKAGAPWGVQVVALGGGQFDAYLLEGGLPGLGWTREKSRTKLSGKREGDVVRLATGDRKTIAEIRGGTMVVKQGGQTLATLPRIERKSPTLGAEPPKGAVVLFDGTTAEHWKNGKIVDGLLANTNITSIPTFKSYTAHLEFRTPYKPYARGQGRGNSGVYHAGRYETQVLDSFGLTGEQNECGGIYSIARPRLNMCLPPLAWQTYDVAFTAPKLGPDGKVVEHGRITVRLNGVVIHDNQELAKTHTTAAPVHGPVTDAPGPIFIQAHGNPVFYRNIWVVPR